MTTHNGSMSFAASAACCHQEGQDPIGGENTSAQGQACYFTGAIQRSSRARCLLQIALIQRIHTVQCWLLTNVNGNVIPTELVYLRKKGKVHLSIVPMRSVYFEKYCTMINAVT